MAARFWVVYIGSFLWLTILAAILEGSATFLAAADLNDATGYQVDEIGSGGGLFGLVRQSTGFLVTFAPKAISFNYSFLQGDLELLMWILRAFYGITLFIMLGQMALGIFRQNV